MAALAHSYKDVHLTNNEEFRKAMILAVDKAALVAAIYPDGTAIPAASLINVPTHIGYIPGLDVRPYDPDQARKILEDNGWVGEQVTLYSWTTWSNIPELPTVMEAIAGYLDAVGFDAQLRPVDYTAVRPNLLQLEGNTITDPNPIHGWFVTSTGAFETLVRIGLLAKPDGGLYSAYHDSGVVDTLYTTLSAEIDPDARAVLATDFNQALYDTWGLLPHCRHRLDLGYRSGHRRMAPDQLHAERLSVRDGNSGRLARLRQQKLRRTMWRGARGRVPRHSFNVETVWAG